MPETPLPPWPTAPLAIDSIVLRAFSEGDVPMVINLAIDPFVPLEGMRGKAP